MMGASEDIAKIVEQEAALAFDRFDEAVAFEIGMAIRERGLAEKWPIIVDIQTFDRPLFYAALPGSTVSNAHWARRKRNVVQRFLKSTYRMVLEQQSPDRTFKPGEALDPVDYVLAGGGFPITVKAAGVIGVMAVSGLPEREDHGVIVEVLCRYLKLDHSKLALTPA